MAARKQRRRLPRRIYWVRRGLVLGAALLLVFGIGKLLGGTGDDGPSAATNASNNSPARAGAGAVTYGPVAPPTKLRPKAQGPLLPPTGDCDDDDVSVLPSVPHAWVGTPVVIQLALQGTQAACTFKVTPQSMVVKIDSAKGARIWSSQDCPGSIPTTEVVVRSGQPVQVPVTWSGRGSDDDCTRAPNWALPGFYHVYAAAYGSTPTDVQFEMTLAPTKIVTRTPKPRPSPSVTGKPSVQPSASAATRAAVTTPATAPAVKPTKPTVTGSAKPSQSP